MASHHVVLSLLLLSTVTQYSEYSSVFIWANTNNPPPGFYLHSQADVGPDYHKQSSVPCIDANKCPSRGDDPSLSGARLSLSNSSTPHWLHGKHNIIAATIIEATAWENVNTEKYFMTLGKIFYGFMNVENVDYIGSNPSLGTKVWFTGCKFLHGCVKSLQEMLFEQDFENLSNISQKFEHHENFPTSLIFIKNPTYLLQH